MATLRGYKYDYFINHGFLHNEALIFSRQYTMAQIRELSYMRTMVRSRTSLRNNLIKKGLSYAQYKRYIATTYSKYRWGKPNQETDIWKMLRKYRDEAIARGKANPNDKSGYIVPVRKGSHHKGDISKGDLDRQRARSRYQDKAGKPAKGRVGSTLDRIAELNARIKQERNPTKLNSMVAERNKLWGTIS